MFFSVTLIRVGMARFRINHLVTFYWGYIALIGFAGMILLVLDAVLGMGGSSHEAACIF
ncbi:hypothetical protein [Methanogenium cariaci]|uniref:hypothetical protein n=1 Tax=Methanogenium cariaci TaxID=2197 RepID=UPI002481570E|nr:hypothetical protein [Methanogenium cariaci]